MNEVLTVSSVSKSYGRREAATHALDEVSLSVAAKEFVGIMGPSGSGKTTLLNCVSTIDRPDSGSIQIDGQEITALKGKELSRFRRERLGFIFQDCNLLDTLTAFENIALALAIMKTPGPQVKARVEQIAALLGISDCLGKYPYQMSGGQQQRAAAARAMVTSPALILADEPTGSLDSRSSGMLLDCMENLNKEHGATILMVTHDAFTASYCQRVIFLRDGRIFRELDRGNLDRRAFFTQIIRSVTQFGGEMADVL